MYKLIATDMDKTLLNSKHEVDTPSVKAIIKAQELGVKFVLASGRPTGAMTKYIKPLELDKYESYIISYNGGRITDCKTMESIYEKGLNEEEARYIFSLADKYNTSVVTYYDGCIIAYNINEYTKIEQNYTGMEIKEITDINDLKFKEIIKFMIIDNPEKIKEIFDEIYPANKDKFFLAISDPHFLEVANKDVDKGKTLDALAKTLNINKDEIIACGDSYNDMAMLEYAGTAVAAENAVEEVKKISKYVSKNYNDNLMEDVIKKYVLNS